MVKLETIKENAQKGLNKAQDLKALDVVYKQYLGKKGELSLVLKSLVKLPKLKRVKIGKEANDLKNFLQIKFAEKSLELKENAAKAAEEKEWIDVTAPGKKPLLGHLHPLTQVQSKAQEIFTNLGFSVIEGPEIETEWYNFDSLNIPKEHPARDIWDTFWLKTKPEKGAQKLLLRTHTSPAQVRYMEKNQPPLRIVVPGRIFRHEATDASHEINFYQMEGLMIGKDVSVANFKAIIQEFFKRFFGEQAEIRFRPSHFPFTEPSFEIDMACLVCSAKGCSSCSSAGWLEMMGAGMVHPNVFKASGLNPENWQGFAFGMGLDRLAMMKYKVNDIRLFYSGDLRFLQQF